MKHSRHSANNHWLWHPMHSPSARRLTFLNGALISTSVVFLVFAMFIRSDFSLSLIVICGGIFLAGCIYLLVRHKSIFQQEIGWQYHIMGAFLILTNTLLVFGTEFYAVFVAMITVGYVLWAFSKVALLKSKVTEKDILIEISVILIALLISVSPFPVFILILFRGAAPAGYEEILATNLLICSLGGLLVSHGLLWAAFFRERRHSSLLKNSC